MRRIIGWREGYGVKGKVMEGYKEWEERKVIEEMYEEGGVRLEVWGGKGKCIKTMLERTEEVCMG